MVGKSQIGGRTLNSTYEGAGRFKWTSLYETLADKLLEYEDRRDELVSGVHRIASKIGVASYLQDQFVNGSTGPLKDICPFTVMGMFNRGITDSRRKAIASELATFLGVDDPDSSKAETDDLPETETPPPPIEPYSVDDIISDGCFIAPEKLDQFLERLRTKKNLILQGPPGTGKTWLAKRLAFPLIGERDDRKVRAVQFHPNLSYEDFVRGLRPAGDGKLTLVDGPFLEMSAAAGEDPESPYVFVIEEINRGNPAQIFGELLTLLEVDKRTPNEALQLSYNRANGERVFIPDNVYVIGTMNIADRSLALVDLALRRRFAFIDLEPTLGKAWRDWVHQKWGIDFEILEDIEGRVKALNSEISADKALGPQFRVGHSYVTPPFGVPIDDAREWFRQVVNSEIGPLLDEYWFDDLEKSEEARDRLLKGF